MTAREFIELNTDQLEDDAHVFCQMIYNDLDWYEADMVIDILNSCDIDITDERYAALDVVIQVNIINWKRGINSGGVSGMPVKDFVLGFFNNTVGFSVNEVSSYMLTHKDRYRDVEIYDNKGTLVIDWRYIWQK